MVPVRNKKLIFLILLVLVSFIILYGYYLWHCQASCNIKLSRVELRQVNATGVVYSPCNYTGVLNTEPPMRLSVPKCVAAGFAGGRLYAVFALSGASACRDGFPDVEASDRCYVCRHCVFGCARLAVLYGVPLVAVVDVESGDAYLVWSYFNINLTAPLTNEDVVFGGGVYVKPDALRGTPDVTCPERLIPNTALKIKAYVNKSALVVGSTLREAGGVFVDVTPR